MYTAAELAMDHLEGLGFDLEVAEDDLAYDPDDHALRGHVDALSEVVYWTVKMPNLVSAGEVMELAERCMSEAERLFMLGEGSGAEMQDYLSGRREIYMDLVYSLNDIVRESILSVRE